MASSTLSVDLEDLKQQAKGYDYIRFTWSDYTGIARGKHVPVHSVDSALHEGVGCLAGNVAFGPRSEIAEYKGILEHNHCNIYSKPASDSIVHLPWAGVDEYKVGEIICEPTWQKDGTVQKMNPRYIARNQLEILKSLGLELMSALECEFMFVKDGKPLYEGVDYCTHLRFGEVEKVMFDIEKNMHKCGILAETLEVEYSPGQVEMAFKPVYGIQAADSMFRFKNGVKEIARKHGLMATFMSKPFNTKDAGCGTHFNHSLWNIESGENAFFDGSKPDNLSDIARYWIGGVFKHMDALTALKSPTVNCYRRMHMPWAGDKKDWDLDNRFVTWRVKSTAAKGTYMESRIPSGASNVYIVMAATVAAGIDGIRNKIEPPPRGQNPEAKPLPFTLQEALDALEADTTLTNAIGKEFVDWFLAAKRLVELEKFGNHDMKVGKEEEYEAEREEYLEMC